MKPTLHVTTVLLLAAVATGACSKRDTPKGQAALPRTADITPLPAQATAVAAGGEDAFAPAATAKAHGSMSFADGEAAYQAKQYGDATTIFERYVGQRPKNPWGHYMLGLSAWKNGDPTKSEEAFRTALSLDPAHAKSLVNLGRLLIDQQRHDDAIETLTVAADAHPESTEVQRLLARTYKAQGKTDEAMTVYRYAIEVNELDVWSMNDLGLLLLDAKRAEEAVPLFTKAAELRHDVAAFHNNLGMALEHTGRFKAAAAAYSEALAADPRHAKAKQNLVRVAKVKEADEQTASK